MKKNIKVAVLMATFEGEKWIEEQIKSIANQTVFKPSIFISDDNSTDNTVSLASKCIKRYKINIKFITKKSNFNCDKKGSSQNFLKLIASFNNYDQFDYIAFSDQDDIWHKNHLKQAIKLLSTGDYGGYSSSIIAFWDNGFELISKKTGKISQLNHLFESAGPGHSYVLPKKSFLPLQEFVIKNFKKVSDLSFHDWFIFAFMRSRGFEWIIDSFTSVKHRQHSKNVIGVSLSWKSIKYRIKLLYGEWFRKEVLLLAKVLNCNHKIIHRLKRFSLFDRIIIFCTIWQHRRRFKDKIAIMLLPIFSK